MAHAKILLLEGEVSERWARFHTAPAEPGNIAWVRTRLALMYQTDQQYRDLYVEFADASDEAQREIAPIIKRTDAEHRIWLSDWLVTHPWPSLSTFGASACEHAWMIALHADGHPFQSRALKMVEALLPMAEAYPMHYATLFDRVALSEGRLQRYGMFYTVRDGVEETYPVELPEGLKERRAQLELGDRRFRR
jgi:hypothetical protein